MVKTWSKIVEIVHVLLGMDGSVSILNTVLSALWDCAVATAMRDKFLVLGLLLPLGPVRTFLEKGKGDEGGAGAFELL